LAAGGELVSRACFWGGVLGCASTPCSAVSSTKRIRPRTLSFPCVLSVKPRAPDIGRSVGPRNTRETPSAGTVLREKRGV
jgi:hypothetical protein